MSSVRKIAQQAGVSITTVSRVLNNDASVRRETRERVLSVANRTGYVPAVGRRATTFIAFAYTQEVTLAHPFDSAVLDGVVRGLDDSRFDAVVMSLRRDKQPNETYTQFFLRKGVRGVILRTMEATRDVCEAIAREGFPHVVISERFESDVVNFIDADSKLDSQHAIEYLITLGHQRIAFAMHNIPDRDHLDRLEGYRVALEKHGLSVDEDLIFRQPFTISGGASVAKIAVSLPNPATAIFFADPMMAVGAVKEANRCGIRVPEDLSIIGIDDTDIRFGVCPTLTAVCQDAGALGFEAAQWLTRSLVAGGEKRFQRTLPTFFEVNASTSPPAFAAAALRERTHTRVKAPGAAAAAARIRMR